MKPTATPIRVHTGVSHPVTMFINTLLLTFAKLEIDTIIILGLHAGPFDFDSVWFGPLIWFLQLTLLSMLVPNLYRHHIGFLVERLIPVLK